jgi:hypothetical protein
MKCSDVDRFLPDIVDGVAVDNSQDIEVQSHLKTCPDCSELVSDLKLIVSESRQLADSEEPSPRVWARIAADLRAEGLIREPEVEAARPVLIPTSRRRWNPFWLAPVAVAILAAGAYVLNHNPTQTTTTQTAQQAVVQQPPAQVAQQTPSQEPTTQPSAQPHGTQALETSQQVAKVEAPAHTPQGSPQVDQAAANSPSDEAALSQPTTVDDNQFLTEVSERAPTMRATYANQLHAVNGEIRETQAYITRYPGDVDARQHLLEVYQEKAMLYQMALDRIQ